MKKYKILPKEAIIRFFILIIILALMAAIINKIMPQYAKWEQEDEFLTEDRRIKMSYIRNDEYPLITLRRKELVEEEQKKKILIIGDSYITGNGFSNINYAWWRQLELELYDRGYYNVEICAAGIGGHSTYDEMNWLVNTSLVKDVEPDIIIIGYVRNDPELDDEKGNPIVKHTDKIDYFSNNIILKTIKQLFPNITYKINNMINDKVESKGEYNDETGYPYNIYYDVLTNEKWSKEYNNLAVKPLGKYLNSLEIPSFVVTTPDTVNSKFKQWYNVLDLFEKSNIKTYNMYSEFSKRIENSKDIYNKKANPVNGHPGTLSTKFYAEYVADLLESNYPEVLGKKYEEKKEYPLYINDWTPYKIDLEAVEEQTDYVKYKIKYPNKENVLTMPINEDYIRLSLQYPVSIKEIEINGTTLEKTKLYVTTVNEELGYDDQTMKRIGTKEGNDVIFELQEQSLVTSIGIHANIQENDEIEITIKK